DGLAELFSSLGILDRHIESPLHTAHQFGGESGGGDVESSREIQVGADFFRRSIVEFDDIQLAGKVHSGHRRYCEAASLGVHQEDTVACNDDKEIGDGGVRDK